MAVLDETLSASIGKYLDAGIGIGRERRWIEIAQPEAAAQLASVVRIAAQVDQMAGPDVAVEKPDPRTYGR